MVSRMSAGQRSTRSEGRVRIETLSPSYEIVDKVE